MSTDRQLRAAGMHGVAAGYVGGHRKDLTRQGAIAELHELAAGDMDLLAETAAVFATPHRGELYWYAAEAVALLVEAGADPAAVERHAAARRAPRTMPDLGRADSSRRVDGSR